jgi:hypothetical protein
VAPAKVARFKLPARANHFVNQLYNAESVSTNAGGARKGVWRKIVVD